MLLNFNLLWLIYCFLNSYICNLKKNITIILIRKKMTKADIVAKISEKLGLEKGDVQATVETFMTEVKIHWKPVTMFI